MQLSTHQITRLAQLARLKLTDEEIERLTRELTVIIDYFDQLREVNTDGVEPAMRMATHPPSLRPDTVVPSLPRDRAVSNAPDSDSRYFRVPKVIG